MDAVAPIFVALTDSGANLARQLTECWPGAEVHGLASRVTEADHRFEHFIPHMQTLFQSGKPMIGVCAAGIIIRALAPIITDKHSEPPVLALAEDGSAIVPLLGGHFGANALARDIADILQIKPAITTAGDNQFGIALDAPPAGWRLGNPQHYKSFAAKILGGASVRFDGAAEWLTHGRLPMAQDGELAIAISVRTIEGSPTRLVYQPARLALGVGCERGTDAAEIIDLVRTTLTRYGLAQAAVAGIFSIDLKMDEDALHALASELDVPIRFFDAATLEAQAARLAHPSELVFREVGCHGVAEGAALAAAGPDAELLIEKTKSRRATCAVALAPDIIDCSRIGVARGHLAVVGIGPGDSAWRTPEAALAVRTASDLVGYSLYLDLLGPLATGKVRHDYQLGEERDRVRAALDLAASGKQVALICSGDPGIYAMATLVFELLENEKRTDWQRIGIQVMPGISALQAAAARAGAPLGHDFCAISLSDLLTPWPVIEQRVQAAAAGDFVIAFYNPVSRRRTTQLARAIKILRARHPGIVRNAPLVRLRLRV